jgi:DNA-binding response OmpR family regulator
MNFKQYSKNLSILIVEDHEDFRSVIVSILQPYFAIVDQASNATSAIELFEEFYDEHEAYYDIVLTDLKMPKTSGLQLSKNILKIHENQHIIVMSAYDDSQDLIDFINVGVNGFIRKPFEENSFFTAIAKAVTEIAQQSTYTLAHGYSWSTKLNILYKDEQPIKLSSSECAILEVMVKNPLQVFSKEDIYNIITTYDLDKEFSYDSVRSIIKRLRSKTYNTIITNVYGQGYRIDQESSI